MPQPGERALPAAGSKPDRAVRQVVGVADSRGSPGSRPRGRSGAAAAGSPTARRPAGPGRRGRRTSRRRAKALTHDGLLDGRHSVLFPGGLRERGPIYSVLIAARAPARPSEAAVTRICPFSPRFDRTTRSARPEKAFRRSGLERLEARPRCRCPPRRSARRPPRRSARGCRRPARALPVGVLDAHGDERQVLAVGVDRRPVRHEHDPGRRRRPSSPRCVATGWPPRVGDGLQRARGVGHLPDDAVLSS